MTIKSLPFMMRVFLVVAHVKDGGLTSLMYFSCGHLSRFRRTGSTTEKHFITLMRVFEFSCPFFFGGGEIM